MSIQARQNIPEPVSIVDLLEGERVLECRVPCECCGAAVTLVDEGIVTCDFCGTQRAVGRTDVMALFMPFALSPDQALVEMKRWLRQEGHRATAVARVVPMLIPYWRVKRRVLAWETGKAEGDLERNFAAVVHRFEHFEPAIGTCEALGPDLPFDEQKLIAFPLDRSLVADETHLVKVTSGPSSLPARVSRTAATADDEEAISDGNAIPSDRLHSGFVPGDPSESESVELPVELDGSDPADPFAGNAWVPETDSVHTTEMARSVSLVYIPFFSLRYTFENKHHSVISCGRTGTVTGLMDGDFKDSHPLAERDEAFDVAGMPPMQRLECPTCSADLNVDGGLLTCQACDCVYRNEDGELIATTCEVVEGDGLRLPFWRLAEKHRPGNSREPSVHIDLDAERDVVERYVWIPAFSPCPPVLARRLAVLLAESQPAYVCERGPAFHLRHRECRSVVSAARSVAGLVIDEIESYSAAVAGAVPIGSFDDVEPVLVWIPFEGGQGFYVDPVSGVRVSEAVFDDGRGNIGSR